MQLELVSDEEMLRYYKRVNNYHFQVGKTQLKPVSDEVGLMYCKRVNNDHF